jgi:hypothetical protein
MTLTLGIIIPLSMLLYSNSRVTEVKETLRAEMAAGNSRITETLRSEIAATRSEMTAGFSRISSEIQSLKEDLKIHELEHHHK